MNPARRAASVSAAIISTALASTLLVATPASATPAASSKPYSPRSWRGPVGQEAIDTNWKVRDASTRQDPSALVAAVRLHGTTPRTPLAVISIRDAGGEPRLTRTPVADSAAARTEIAKLQKDSSVLSVAMDAPRKVIEGSTPQAVPTGKMAAVQSVSNDPGSGKQWALAQLGVAQLWSQGYMGAGQVVAVIDSGTDGRHEDLRGRVLQGADYVAGRGNGWYDPHGHGTHVAGTIAANANNGIGVAGVAPQSLILPVRVANAEGYASDAAIIEGVKYSVARGAKVLNMSLGGDNSGPLNTVIKYALSRDVMVVSVAGNYRELGNQPQYPGATPGVLAVAATDSGKRVARFSNTGTYVRIAAPGVDVYSTVPGTYADSSGTSMAAPHVAGIAALLRQATGGKLKASTSVNILLATTTDISSAGYDVAAGYGLVDPIKAVQVGRCAVAGTCGVPLPSVGANTTQRYIQRAHLDLAATVPSTTQLLAWQRSLNAGTAATAMTTPLTRTTGYRNITADLYLRNLLKTAPSSATVAAHGKVLAGGATHQELYARILSSAQYFRESGNTNAAWVNRAITHLTGRAPSASSAKYWNQLTTRYGRLWVARALMKSDVSVGRIVDLQTRKYWGRTLSSRDRSAWIVRIKKGTRVESLCALLVASPIYRARVA